MMNHCSINDKPKRIAAVLACIPYLNTEMVSVKDVCGQFKSDVPSCSSCRSGIIWMLDFLGVIEKNSEGNQIKASSPTAYYFLQSLSQFISTGDKFNTQWHATTFNEDSRVLDVGHRLVGNMEKIRTRKNGVEPLRKAYIAHVVIKARVRWDGCFRDRYLVVYDSTKRHYELIGLLLYEEKYVPNQNRSFPFDEIKERLTKHLVGEFKDLKENDVENLNIITAVSIRGISASRGADTAYTFFVCECHFKIPQITLAKGTVFMWVTYEELIGTKTLPDITIYAKSVKKIEGRARANTSGRIKDLGRSLDWQNKPKRQDVVPGLRKGARVFLRAWLGRSS